MKNLVDKLNRLDTLCLLKDRSLEVSNLKNKDKQKIDRAPGTCGAISNGNTCHLRCIRKPCEWEKKYL